MSERPNILMIVSDQLAQRAVHAYGHPRAVTPNLDALAARGRRFAHTYTPCPICMPARASFWTGRSPHETGVTHNGRDLHIPPDMATLGTAFSAAGYTCAHFGKGHDMGGLRGFGIRDGGRESVDEPAPWPWQYESEEDRAATRMTVDFLRDHRDGPFLAVADLNNPHEICLWVGDHAMAHDDEPLDRPLPALPPNFRDADRDARPLAVRFNCCANFRVAQTQGWTEENYRHYLAAYDRYVARMDLEAGRILAALAQRPDAERTLVILFADHGDAMTSHGLVTKAAHFYEEVVRVPLILAGPGIAADGACQEGPLVSLIDVVPTLCDWAGIDAPPALPGRSLLPWLGASPPVDDDRKCVVSTWRGDGEVLAPARMLRTRRFKYMHYLEDNAEELYDLERDPWETRNLAGDKRWRTVRDEHRDLLRDTCAATGDAYGAEPARIAPGKRAHPEGACPFHHL